MPEVAEEINRQRPGRSLRVQVLKHRTQFLSLEEEWEDLYHNCPQATPFQSWAWLYSWWEYYGEGYKLRLVTVRSNEGLLIGIIPLMLERKAFFRRMLFVGTGLSDYLDVIVRTGWEDAVSEAGVQALERIGSWHVADLQLVRRDAAAWGILRRWSGPQIRVWQDACPVIEAKPWDELLASLSRNLRSTVRRALRRSVADGLYSKIADTSDTKQAARRLVALHREGWQERNIGPEHLTKRFESFIIVAADRMVFRGLGCISEFRENGEILIADFLVLGRDFCGTYLLGTSQKALQRYQWSSLYIRDAVDVAHSRNKGYVDLLRGQEPYKLRWRSETVPTFRLILGHYLAIWITYAGYHALRSKGKLYIRSEGSPQWIKSAMDRYRTLRYLGHQYIRRIRGCP